MKYRRIPAFLLCVLLFLYSAACERYAEPVSSPIADSMTPAPTILPVPTQFPNTEMTPEPAQAPGVITCADFPRLGVSGSAAPMAEAVCSALLGERQESVGVLINYNKTTRAYSSLLDGQTDLLIVGEANEEILKEKEKRRFTWRKTPLTKDALVFIVNGNNPVESITIEQIRKIYTKDITNWSQIGGEDIPIIPYQRSPETDSQILMEKNVMKGVSMMEAPKDCIVDVMGDPMDVVKGYDNAVGAIGYTMYEYAVEMKAVQNLKLLKLEGFEPSPETIRTGTYPIVTDKYVVISADAAVDSPAERLYHWLLSDEGQALIASQGYISIKDCEIIPRGTGKAPIGVFWDGPWEGLTPLAAPTWVTAYAGQRLSDEWPALTGCLYGLMTAEGTAVTPPVYSKILPLVWYAYFGSGCRQLEALVLQRGNVGSGHWTYTYAARDLSWIYPGTWRNVIPGPDYVILLGEDHMEQVSEDGIRMKSWDYSSIGLEPYLRILTAAHNDGFVGRIEGDMLALGVLKQSPDLEYVLFHLTSDEQVNLTQSELSEMLRPTLSDDLDTWKVETVRTGSLFTRGDESLELHVPAIGAYARFWGDLVVFPEEDRIFLRDGREVLPPKERSGDRRLEFIGFGLERVLLLHCYSRGKTITMQKTWFVRPDGSVLDVTAERNAYTTSLTSFTFDTNVLGIINQDRASYYRVDTGACICDIAFAFEGGD